MNLLLDFSELSFKNFFVIIIAAYFLVLEALDTSLAVGAAL